jgi:MFS transporter, OFA family, oxalate/formate antiporter
MKAASMSSSTLRITEEASAAPSAKRRALAVLLVLGVAVGLGGGFSTIYITTISVFLKPIAAEFHLARTQAAGLGVLAMLGVAAGAALIGRLIDRIGPLKVVVLCVCLTSLLLCLLGAVRDQVILFAALSFLVGVAGAGTMAPGYASVLSRQFDKRFGLTLGLVGGGLGIGGALIPILAQNLISDHGWRQAYMHLGLLAAGVGLLACLLIAIGRGKPIKAEPVAGAAAVEFPGETTRAALRDRRFWLLVAVILATTAASLGISIHLVAMVTDFGFSVSDGARIAALCGLGVGLGRLGCGAAFDLWPARYVAAGSLVLAAMGAALLAFGSGLGFGPLAIGGFLVGFVIGAENDFLAFFVRRYFGLRAFGSINGLLYGANAVGGLLGPIAFGAAFDTARTYASAMWVAVLAFLTAAVAMQFLGPYRYAASGGGSNHH